MSFSFKQIIPQKLKNYYHLAIAVLAVARYNYPARHLMVIGVTGTDGKTTTSTLIYHLLKSTGKKVALISTVAAYIGDEEIDTGFHVTSPDPFPLQALLARIHRLGYEYVVLEATSHGFDQFRLFGTNIRIAVITNITHDHFDYHKTYDRYLAAKAKIFNKAKIAIINRDDQSYAHLKKYLKRKTHILPYTLKEANRQEYISNHFPQNYNRMNALAAVTVAKALKLKKDDYLKGLTTFPGVAGRLQAIPNKRSLHCYVDFAHTPNALKSVLTALRKTHPKAKLIAIYGCAGLRDAVKRPIMGMIGSQLADEVIFTSEDPRTEDVKTIIRQMKDGVTTNHGHVHAIVDRRLAISFAINHLAKAGDVVAVLGKGHEKSLNLNGSQEIPWSDAKEMSKALKLT